jgi:hypothetical protein
VAALPIPGDWFPLSYLPYEEEILSTIEAGFKLTTVRSHAFQVDTFYYDYKDYQISCSPVSGVVINSDG